MDASTNSRREQLLQMEEEIGVCVKEGFSSLKFPDRIEALFHADTLKVRRKRLFYLSLLGGLLYSIFLITDRVMLPDIYVIAWKVRLGIAWPMGLAAALLMRLRMFSRYIDHFADFILMLTSVSIAFILSLSHHPNVVHFHVGVLLPVMYGNVVMRLRFRHAFFVSWATFLVYILMLTRIELMTPPLILNSLFVMFSAIALSQIAAYQMEYDVRWNYLRSLAGELEAIHLGEARDEMEKLSICDALTGVANRRHFDNRFDAEWRSALRTGSSLSLLFLDVDDFKAYNDLLGHQEGDVCLQKVAAIVKDSIQRSLDVCARYGGEEFVVLLPNTPLEMAMKLAQRIQERLASANLPHPKSRAASWVTVSLGVSSVIPVLDMDRHLLVEQADKALYLAKSLGRNRVHAFSAH